MFKKDLRTKLSYVNKIYSRFKKELGYGTGRTRVANGVPYGYFLEENFLFTSGDLCDTVSFGEK